MPARRPQPRRPKANRPRSKPAGPPRPWVITHPHAAGIDVHSDTHWVCVGPGPDGVRQFGAYTCGLRAVADWLAARGVTTVAMESTGVYWIPLFELLEARGFEVYLVEPGQLHSCGGRPKTDRLDCQWIQRLHTYGLLKGSFRPPDALLALRGYVRQRQTVVRAAAGHVQRVQKALEQMNVKLAEVLSDITGVSGTKIIDAVLAGERDPAVLAAHASPKCAADRAEFAKALAGTWRAEHLFALKQEWELLQFHHRQIDACDEQIRAELGRLPDRAGAKAVPVRPRQRGRKKNDLRFSARGPLFRALGVGLTAIDGIDGGTALVILAEIGVDVSKFPTEKHFAAWLGVSPRTGRSNRTEKRGRPRRGKHRVKQALRMAAQAVGRTQTPLGAFDRRIKSRIGGAGAVTATARKLACLVWRLLTHGAEYVRQGLDEYEGRVKAKLAQAVRRKAAALGYELVAKPAAAPAEAGPGRPRPGGRPASNGKSTRAPRGGPGAVRPADRTDQNQLMGSGRRGRQFTGTSDGPAGDGPEPVAK